MVLTNIEVRTAVLADGRTITFAPWVPINCDPELYARHFDSDGNLISNNALLDHYRYSAEERASLRYLLDIRNKLITAPVEPSAEEVAKQEAGFKRDSAINAGTRPTCNLILFLRKFKLKSINASEHNISKVREYVARQYDKANDE